MDAKEFCYWLQGFLEITDAKSISEEQTQIVKDHLNLVFEKVTPNRKIDREKLLERVPSGLGEISDKTFKPICSDGLKTYC